MSYEFFWDKRTKDHERLTTHNSQLIAQKRLKDETLNSRGLLSPRFFNDYIILASAKTPFEQWVMSDEMWAVWNNRSPVPPHLQCGGHESGICNPHHRSPSSRRFFYVDTIKPEAWKPPAIYVRVFQTPVEWWVVSNEQWVFSRQKNKRSCLNDEQCHSMSSWTCLTLFNLLTLGKIQASLSLLSLNRKFQDLSA